MTEDDMMRMFVEQLLSEASPRRKKTLMMAITKMHVGVYVAFLIEQAAEHKGHEHDPDCPFSDPYGITQEYLDEFSQDIMRSCEATFKVNGFKFRKNPNQALVDELLKEFKKGED